MEEPTREVNELRQRVAELEAMEAEMQQTNAELRLFKAIVEASREAIAVSDPDGRLVYVNPAHEKLFGRPLQEAQELNYRQYYPPESAAVLDQVVAPALARGESWEGELEVLDARGRRFPLWERADAIRDAQGLLLYGFGFMHDISARRQAMAALRESEQNLRALFETIQDYICVLDLQGSIMEVNPEMARRLGYDKDELIGQNFLKVHPPEYRTEASAIMEKMLSGEADFCNVPLLTKSGGHIPVETRVTRGRWSNQEVFFGIIRDITERQQMQQRLADALELNQKIIAASPLGIVVYDTSGECISANEAGGNIIGATVEQVLQQNFNTIDSWKASGLLAAAQEVLSTGQEKRLDLHAVTSYGRELWLECRLLPFASGGAIHLLLLYDDVSQRRQMEQHLADALEFSRTIIQVSTMGIAVFNAEGRCILANEAVAAIVGGSVKAILQLNFYQLESWKDSGLLETAIRALESGRLERREIHVTSTFGKELWMDCHFITFTSGGEQHLLLLLDDISGRKLAEAALKRSYDDLERRVEERTAELKKANQELRFEIAERHRTEEALKEERDFSAALLDTLGALVVVLDLRGRIVRFNQACETTTGYTSREVLGKYVWDLFLAPEELEGIREVFQRLTAGEFPSFYENHWLTKDGARRLIAWSNTCLTDVTGEVAFVIGTGIDVTEQRRAEEAWRRSQQQQKAILDNIPDLAWLKDAESRFIAVNQAFGEACGVAPEDLVGKTDLDIWPRKLAEGYRADDREVMQSRRRKQVEEPLADRAGQAAWIETIKTPIVSETGEVLGTAGIARDITARKRIEEALKESEARFRSIFDNASAGMALVDRDGYVIMANEADCRFLGYPAEELIGLHFSRFTHPDDLDLDAGLYESLVKGERASYLIDKRYLRKDGEVVWGRLSVSLIRNESGQVHYTVIVCEDITEHRQAEQALRESEERYHSIFANSHAVMLLIDPETADIVDANPAAAAFYGYPSERLRAMKISEINMLPRERILAAMQAAREEAQRFFNFPHRLATGEIRDVEVYSGPVQVHGQRLLYSIIHDVTDRRRAEEALRKREEDYRLLVNSIPAVVFKGYADWSVDFFDDKIEELTGYPKADFDSRRLKWSDVVLDEDLPVLKQSVRQALSGSRSYVREYRIRHQNGHLLWLQARAQIIADAAGKIQHVSGVFFDITPRKEMEAALYQEKEKYRVLVEESPLGVAIIGSDNSYKYLNPKFEEMFGYTLEDIPTRRAWFTLAYPDPSYRRQIMALWQEDLQQFQVGQSRQRQFTVTCKDGSQKIINFTSTILESGDQLMIYEDITERQRAAEELQRYKDHLEQLVAERTAALKESEEKFRTIFEGAPLGIGLGDREGRILAVNPAVSRITGFSPEEMHLVRHLEIIQPEDRPAYERLRQELWEGKRESYEAEFRFWRKDGSQGWGRMQATLIRTGEGEPEIALAMFEDITREKEVEAEIEAYQERLRALASELSLTEERERRHLATLLHDDVGQLLAMSKIKLQDMRQEVPPGRLAQAADEVRDFIEQAIRHTRSLTFELSLPILYEMGLEEALEWLAEQFQRQHGLLVKVRRDEQPKPLAEGPRVLLFRLVRELLTNVVKHAQASQATISLARQNDQLCIHLKDDGVGFDMGQITTPGGPGFGLFSIRERLSHLGGRLEIDSTPGQGTRVIITVPLAAPDTSSSVC